MLDDKGKAKGVIEAADPSMHGADEAKASKESVTKASSLRIAVPPSSPTLGTSPVAMGNMILEGTVEQRMVELLDGGPKQLDWGYIRSIFDPRPLVIPMTWRRIGLWLSLATIVAVSLFTDMEYGWWTSVESYTNGGMLPIMIAILALEPLMLMASIWGYHKTYQAHLAKPAVIDITADYIPKMLEEGEVKPTFAARALAVADLENPVLQRQYRCDKNKSLGVLIACHNSAKKGVIAETVRHIRYHVHDANIFICDNANTSAPTDDTRDVIQKISPGSTYLFCKRTASKTEALLWGAKYVENHHPHISEVLILDDDTRVPRSTHFNLAVFNDPTIHGIAPMVQAESPYKHPPMLSKWQNLEYALADANLALMSHLGALNRVHGAASVWRLQTLVKFALLLHDAKFDGEDFFMAILVTAQKDPEFGALKIILAADLVFPTQVPQTYFGSYPNLTSQRVRSWKKALWDQMWKLIGRVLIKDWTAPTTTALVVRKLDALYRFHTALNHALAPLWLFLVAGSDDVYIALAISICLKLCLLSLFNGVVLPEERRHSWMTVVTFPLYQVIDFTLGTWAFLRYWLTVFPIEHPRASIKDRLHDGDLRLPRIALSDGNVQIDSTRLSVCRSGVFKMAATPSLFGSAGDRTPITSDSPFRFSEEKPIPMPESAVSCDTESPLSGFYDLLEKHYYYFNLWQQGSKATGQIIPLTLIESISTHGSGWQSRDSSDIFTTMTPEMVEEIGRELHTSGRLERGEGVPRDKHAQGVLYVGTHRHLFFRPHSGYLAGVKHLAEQGMLPKPLDELEIKPIALPSV